MTRLFSYKLTADVGFAPNPFFGLLTLATCKPRIRFSKKIGDWIAGFTSQSLSGDLIGEERLIYLAQITDKLTIANYFRDSRFESKKPVPSSPNECLRHGDNIYKPLKPLASEPREFRQLFNENHWDGDERACGNCRPGPSREHDLSGGFVLISERFVYFGAAALMIPRRVWPDVPRGQSAHGQQTKDEERARAFIEFAFGKAQGKKMICHPWTWPSNSDCWKANATFNEANREARTADGRKAKKTC